jgi:hypothetical protein
MGQGAIADRAHKWLDQSDRGMVLLRKISWPEIEAIRGGDLRLGKNANGGRAG